MAKGGRLVHTEIIVKVKLALAMHAWLTLFSWITFLHIFLSIFQNSKLFLMQIIPCFKWLDLYETSTKGSIPKNEGWDWFWG